MPMNRSKRMKKQMRSKLRKSAHSLRSAMDTISMQATAQRENWNEPHRFVESEEASKPLRSGGEEKCLTEEGTSQEDNFESDASWRSKNAMIDNGNKNQNSAETDDKRLSDVPQTRNVNNMSLRSRSYAISYDDANEDYVIEKTIQVRSGDTKGRLSFRRSIKKFLSAMTLDVEVNDEEEGYPSSINIKEPQTQYNLTTRKRVKGNICQRFLGCLGLYYADNYTQPSSDRILIDYLHWTFRASFTTVFLSSLISFILMLNFFSMMIYIGYITGLVTPTCLTPELSNYAQALGLSWTTFTTVGYGHIYPSMNTSEGETCGFTNMLTALEAFVGVLYAGFISAIMFGKVLRVMSQAQVTFSDPLLVRFEHYNAAANKNMHISCPIVEFQIVNDCYNEQGGEIIDAVMTCMAIKNDSKDVTSRNRISIGIKSSKMSQDMTDPNMDSEIKELHTTYSKVDIVSPKNPFFKRIWIAQHILDDQSPLLLPRVRKLIRDNRGSWPHTLNTSESLRSSINFDQLVVSLNGTSNISGANVFTQKVYDHFDMNVGYKFVNLVYQDENTNRVMLDLEMINDVVEQSGGGGEILVNYD